MTPFALFRGHHHWFGPWMVMLLIASYPSLSVRAANNFRIMVVIFPSTIAAKLMTQSLDPDKMKLTGEIFQHPSMMLQESSLWGVDKDVMKIQGGNAVSMGKVRLLRDSDLDGLWHLTQDEEEFLSHQLIGLVKNEMPQCALLLAHDLPYRHSLLLHRLLLLPNPKQVWIDLNQTYILAFCTSLNI